MNGLRNKLKFGATLAGLAVLLTACIGPAIYQRAGAIGGGYSDKEIGKGEYEVYMMGNGRTFDFVKECALYRGAELTYENKYRYYTVTKVKDESQDYYVSNGYGGSSHVYMPAIKINIQCSTEKPDKGYDAYDYLNKNLVPGTKEYYTVAERRTDNKKEGK